MQVADMSWPRQDLDSVGAYLAAGCTDGEIIDDMRSRNIKPGFFVNDELAGLEPLARLLFIGLWCAADREGRLEDRPVRLKATILPYDNCSIESLLKSLEAVGVIIRYEVEKNRYIQVINFEKHQSPHIKERESTIPAPDKHHTSTVQAPDKPDINPPDSGFLIPDSRSLIPDTGLSDSTVAPKPARKRERKRDFLFEAVAECWIGSRWEGIKLTKAQRGNINSCVQQLRAIDADPSDIPRQWELLRERFDNPTPAALAKHWNTNGTGPKRKESKNDTTRDAVREFITGNSESSRSDHRYELDAHGNRSES